MAADPIPAVAEAEAKGETAEIFADIRAVTGVGVVNLVWRRLAVTPGALPYAWTALKPIYASGLAAAEGRALRREIRPPALPLLPKAALAAAGVDGLGLRSIRAILESYDRTNAMNLVALSALLARIDGEEGPPAATPQPAAEPALPPLPPLPSLDALDPGLRGLVDMLNDFGEEDGTVLASMYRHLAYWPGYLALAWALLAPLAASGALGEALGQARRLSARRAAGIASALAPAPAPDPAALADVQETLRLFTRHPIAKMTAICRALASATPAP